MCHITPIMAPLLPSNRPLKLVSRWQAVPEKREQPIPHVSLSRKPILVQLVDTWYLWHAGISQTFLVTQLSGVSHSLLWSDRPSVSVRTADKNSCSALESRAPNAAAWNTAQLVESSYGFTIVLCTAHAKSIQLLKRCVLVPKKPWETNWKGSLMRSTLLLFIKGRQKTKGPLQIRKNLPAQAVSERFSWPNNCLTLHLNTSYSPVLPASMCCSVEGNFF